MGSNPIYAVGLQAKIVSLNKSYTAAVHQEIIDSTGSAHAEAYAKSLDVGKSTHSSVIEYYVIKAGTGEYGDVSTYEAGVFVIQVEPRLIIGE